MGTQIVKQKSPSFGATMLIVGATLLMITSILSVSYAVYTGSTVYILSEFFDNPLGLGSILSIVIAIFAMMKKKNLPVLIASGVMTIFAINDFFFTAIMNIVAIGSQIRLFANGASNVLDLFVGLNNYILAPLSVIILALTLALIWLTFTLLILACADGKLGFLKKGKGVIGVLFTVAAILVIACFTGNFARYIIGLMAYYADIIFVYGVSIEHFFTFGMLLSIVSDIINSFFSVLSYVFISIGLLSIGAWMKNPTVALQYPRSL